jgi:microcystin degradation protein MlrC
MRPVVVATLIMAAFGPIAKKVIDVETGAPLNRNYRQIPYARVNRPIWPLL